MTTQRFAGQVAIVAGGGSGIGRAAAERLAAEGAQVSVWDISDEALASADFAAHRLKLDQTDQPAVDAAAKEVFDRLGRIDILVVTAGITGPQTTVKDYPLDMWHKVINLNLHGTFYCNRAVVPYMLARKSGRIINMASIAGKEGNANASAYSASKAGVIALTKSLGKELATSGITVNALAPAAVRTAIFDQMTPEFTALMLSKIPMGRFGAVDEIVSLICWIASAESSFTTASVFDASGGRATY